MADAMDWNPTTPPRQRAYDPYDTPFYMPGGWPQSPTNTTSGVFSRKRKHEDATPAGKRICRTLDGYYTATLDHLAQYRIIQMIRRCPRARRVARSSPAQTASVQNNVPRRDERSAATMIPAQQLKNSPPQGGDCRHSSTTTSRRQSASLDSSSLDHATSVLERRNDETPSITQRASTSTVAQQGPARSQQRPASRISTMPQRRDTAFRTPSAAERRRTKWSTLAYMPTTQPRLPTPESDLVNPETPQKSHVPDIFQNMPKLYPSKVQLMTPEAELMSTPPFKTPQLTPVEQEEDISSPEDSPTTQLNNELQAVFDQQDTASDTDSEEFSPVWLITPRITPLEPVTKSLNATTTSSVSKPPHLIPPPVNNRPVLRESRTLPEPAGKHEQPPSSSAVNAAESTTSNPLSPSIADGSAASREKHEIALKIEGGVTPVKNLVSVESSAPEVQLSKLSVNDQEPAGNHTPKAIHHSAEKLRRLTRQQTLRKQALEESLNQYELVPLTEEWDTKVRMAVSKGSGKYSASDLARVVPEYGPPGQDNWLNDEAINGYLALVTAHGKRNDRDAQTPSHHAFNSFFYSNLSTKGPDSIARWSKRAKIGGQNLLDVEKVFIPINSGAHWTLAVVAPKKRTITHYNSMRSASLGDRACKHIKQWVAYELKADFKETEWTIESIGESPLQTNSDDCGVFTITSARQIMLGFTPMSYQSGQIHIQRKRIVAELVNGQLLKSKEVMSE